VRSSAKLPPRDRECFRVRDMTWSAFSNKPSLENASTRRTPSCHDVVRDRLPRFRVRDPIDGECVITLVSRDHDHRPETSDQ
jgi:hypothetical protein